MLRNTFIHLPHVGRVSEKQLWQKGITSWQDILKHKNEYAKKLLPIKHLLELSEQKLSVCDIKFFIKRLPSDQHWRIFQEFRHLTVYLDIETTGLGGPNDYITTISLFDGKNISTYVHGKNMGRFLDDIKKYKVIITYNGKCFDVPFIEREFETSLPHAHLDLRYILKSLGISGGLKKCEKQLGFSRGELEGVDGLFAVYLWKDYLAGNDKALDTLLAYNIEDTINLEKLMMIAYEKKIESLPLDSDALVPPLGQKDDYRKKSKKPKTIKIPYEPDHYTIEKIKKRFYCR